MIISRTPYRVSFLGGGTDYPAWYTQHGGEVLATTINKFCYLTCRYLPPFFQHRIRLVYSKIEDCQTLDEIEHPSVRETLRYLNLDRGVEIHHDGDLPARSGMGTSSSFTVGLLHALSALNGQMLTKHQLAEQSIHIEHELLGETVGSQDQVIASYGGFNHIIFQQDGEISVRPVTLPPKRIDELNEHLCLFYTGIARTASDVADSYVHNLGAKERQLRLMTDMVHEGLSILNSDQDITRFGKLLHNAWQVKRDMGSQVSNPYVDNIYQEALQAGALGGKLLGAGGGGFMLLFVRPSDRERVKERLNQLIHVPFNFESQGSQIIFFDREEDYSIEDRARINRPIQAFQEISPLKE
jgi:D-glycero-alpha-D-manno-heptose-7-phosphate kinase